MICPHTGQPCQCSGTRIPHAEVFCVSGVARRTKFVAQLGLGVACLALIVAILT